MNPQQVEAITKAIQCADLLASDIREAHKLACRDNPLLEILLRELIGDAAKINDGLAELEACLDEPLSERKHGRALETAAESNHQLTAAPCTANQVHNCINRARHLPSSLLRVCPKMAKANAGSATEKARGALESAMAQAQWEEVEGTITVPAPDGHVAIIYDKEELECWLSDLFIREWRNQLCFCYSTSAASTEASSVVKSVLKPYEERLNDVLGDSLWLLGPDDE